MLIINFTWWKLPYYAQRFPIFFLMNRNKEKETKKNYESEEGRIGG